MTISLTIDIIASAYDLLNATEPFKSYSLPDSDDVKFFINKSRATFAKYQRVGNEHTITVSANAVGHLSTLLTTLAHEMIHLHLEETGAESKGGTENTHNGAFRICAAQICRIHGFDPKSFY